MFTAKQLKTAHSKVKSGADFPAYIQEIKAMGVTCYTCYVSDGRMEHHGANKYTASVPAKYNPLEIAPVTDVEHFKAELKAHQQGKTDFMQFISMCAETGVEKWEIRVDYMTCTYFDSKGKELLVEEIPH